MSARGSLLHSRQRWYVFAAASVFFLGISGSSWADTCDVVCGDGQSFVKTASSCDACRMMQCPRTCKLAGVTSCKWCGVDTLEKPQVVTGDVTVRLGPDPSSPSAPTALIPVEGTIVLRPTDAQELGDGRAQVDIQIVEMQLQSVAPLPPPFPSGPMEFQLLPSPPSGGQNTDVLPGQMFPMDSFFDIYYRIEFQGGPVTTTPDGCHLQTVVQPSDPLAGDNTAPAPHTWNSGPVQVMLDDGNRAPFAWILDHNLTIVFTSEELNSIPTVSEWGLAVLALLVMTSGTVAMRLVGGRRRVA